MDFNSQMQKRLTDFQREKTGMNVSPENKRDETNQIKPDKIPQRQELTVTPNNHDSDHEAAGGSSRVLL